MRRRLIRRHATWNPLTPPPPSAKKTVEQLARETPGPNLEDIRVPAAATPSPVSSGGQVDFAALYQHAGLPAAAFTAEQMLEMIAGLPQGIIDRYQAANGEGQPWVAG